MLIILSNRAWKFKKGKMLFIFCLSSWAGKFKRKAKSCLLLVYPAGPGSLRGKILFMFC